MSRTRNLQAISTDRFTFHKATNTFSAEMSDFNDAPSGALSRTLFQRIYDDACDVGFALQSRKTGIEKIFRLEKAVVDLDGDLSYWLFTTLDDSDGELRVHIYND